MEGYDIYRGVLSCFFSDLVKREKSHPVNQIGIDPILAHSLCLKAPNDNFRYPTSSFFLRLASSPVMAFNCIISVCFFLLFAALWVFQKLPRWKRASAPLPPGPKGFPFIGNVLDMPSEKEWQTFARWGETWG